MDLQACFAKVDVFSEKLTKWSVGAPNRPIDGIYNLLVDPMMLRVAAHFVGAARGAETPGIDKVTWSSVRASGVDDWVMDLSSKLKSGTFAFQALRTVLIPKADGGWRPLGILSLNDRIVERALLLLLAPVFDPWLHEASMAFRAARGPHPAIDWLLVLLGRQTVTHIVKEDIAACYPSTRHDLVLNGVKCRMHDRRILRVIRHVLRRPLVGRPAPRIGLAQGAPSSPFFSNLVADPIDRFMDGRANIVSHVRYADDIVSVTTGDKQAVEELEASRQFMGGLGFTLSESKTEIKPVNEKVSFLGHDFWRDLRGVVHYEPSPSRIRRLEDKLTTVALAKGVRASKKMEAMTRIADGWLRYFRPYPVASLFADQALAQAYKMMTAA